jgi:hypothetical protein
MSQKKLPKAIPTMQMLTRVPGMNRKGMFAKELKAPGMDAPVIIDVQRASSAQDSVRRFQDTIDIVKSMPLNDPKRPYAVTIAGVGMKCDGRSSQYDMFFFVASNHNYTIDNHDENFVCQALPE